MTYLTWFLMAADIVGLVILFRKVQKIRFKRRYHLGHKKHYYLNPW